MKIRKYIKPEDMTEVELAQLSSRLGYAILHLDLTNNNRGAKCQFNELADTSQ